MSKVSRTVGVPNYLGNLSIVSEKPRAPRTPKFNVVWCFSRRPPEKKNPSHPPQH